MIEKTILDYLNSKLSVECYMERPKELPTEYVLIEKTGGSVDNTLKSTTVAIQSYSDSLYKASLLNEQVKEAMDNIIELNEVTRSHLNSDYNYTDTRSKEYRYQAVFNLTHY